MLSEKKERAENVYTRLTPWYHIASCYRVLLCGVLQNEKLSKAYSPDDACKSSRACDYLVFSSRSQVVSVLSSLLLSRVSVFAVICSCLLATCTAYISGTHITEQQSHVVVLPQKKNVPLCFLTLAACFHLVS